jgi:two-component system, OmpR family, sensor histidine kinase VicK
VFRSIRTKIVVVFLLLILFALQLIGAYFVRTLTASLIRSSTDTVHNQAQLIATIAGPELTASEKRAPDAPSLLGSFPQLFNGVVYILDKDGVVKDTTAGSALLGQKRTDSVATQTLIGQKQAMSIHYDPVTNQHLLALSVPVLDHHTFIGVVECVVPIQSTYATVRQVTTIFYTCSLIVLLLTGALSIILSRTITRPVLDVTAQARNMAAGDFTKRVDVHSDDEFGELSIAINHLTEKLEDALEANARERDRLQAVITYMGDGVIAFDSDFHSIFSNDAVARLLPEDTTQNSEVADAIGIQPDKMPDDGGDTAFIRKIGDTLLHVRITAIQKNGENDGYVAVIRDVTQQEKLQNARRDFVTNVSHELRTPLTSIKSYIEALQYGDEDMETRTKFLGVIEQETDRMVRLTQDLLHLSGLEMRTDAYTERLIEVSDLLTHAAERFALQAKSQGVALHLGDVPPSSVKGDRDMLDRLLDNLIGNAMKYTASGGRIDLATAIQSDDVTVTVRDSGIGIPKEDLPHVFERFYRVDKARSRRRGGTGLGLALAREIAERHGGRIDIESEVGKGTSVTVYLPLAEEESV